MEDSICLHLRALEGVLASLPVVGAGWLERGSLQKNRLRVWGGVLLCG